MRRAPRHALISGEKRTVDRAFDHPAGDAARVDVLALADVDADVAHRPFSLAEREQIAGQQAARVAGEREPTAACWLAVRGTSRLSAGEHVLNEPAAVEALSPGEYPPVRYRLPICARAIWTTNLAACAPNC